MIQTIQQNKETIAADFTGFINGAYKTNGAVFACVLTRLLLFSEARFQFRRMNNGRPGILFGTKDLQILERPWPNATTGDLLGKAIVDIDLAGNFYATRRRRNDGRGEKIVRLRPDWVTIILGSQNDPSLDKFDVNSELVGYVYEPGGHGSGVKPMFFTPQEVMHWAPIPDPLAHYRGMSWIQPVLTEVLGDRAMETHKLMFFEQGASPNLVVSMDTGKMDRRTFQEWIDLFENEHQGSMNAWKTLYLGSGATVSVVGSHLKDLDYAVVQGHLETRLAAAAGVPAIIVGFSEGLESATYSNFAQARRAFADKTLRPLWRNFAGSLETLVPAPPGAQLWYDDRDIPFLQEDQADEANILQVKSTAIRLLVDAGYDPDSVIAAVAASDLTLLKHTGLYSVQLQPPGTVVDPQTQQPNQNPNINVDTQSNGNGSTNGSNLSNLSGKKLASSREQAILPAVGHPKHLAQALLAVKAGE